VERLIRPDRYSIGVVDEVPDGREVVGARRIRRRNRWRQRACEFREPLRRDDVAGEGLACQRIADRRGQRREVPIQKRLTWYAAQEWLSLYGAQSVAGTEKEHLVVHDRPAGGTAVRIALVLGLGRRKEVLRIELIAPVKLVCRAVHIVGARLRDNRDHRLAL